MTQVLERLIDTTSPLLTRPELKKFNLCRLYLQVITLTDITTSSGREININFWKGNRSSRTSNLKWPRQIRPSQQCWTILRRTLHLQFTESPKSNRLNQGHHLYNWLPHSPLHQQWPTFIDPSTLLLYSRHPGSPNTYSIHIPRHRFSHTSSGTSTPLLPINSVPITVSSWTPVAVSTLYHHKQASPTVTPAPGHTTTNLIHTQSFNTHYSNQAKSHSPPSLCRATQHCHIIPTSKYFHFISSFSPSPITSVYHSTYSPMQNEPQSSTCIPNHPATLRAILLGTLYFPS